MNLVFQKISITLTAFEQLKKIITVQSSTIRILVMSDYEDKFIKKKEKKICDNIIQSGNDINIGGIATTAATGLVEKMEDKQEKDADVI
ncbi:hypothetical protein RFI_33858 [Reticulomyxa filosa]|uniref:Uncharacterized protein n=1 Tax=Reticulomyxa filosa TaxID=46433 RepID=X6LPK0_RETFI|nr:hypothetical protein RFI_33858 [Reticulomyxa filosa]|eukprot:ETO03544.1 hypothetical protein RFI_33858 [Reticulomyxa filosa]